MATRQLQMTMRDMLFVTWAVEPKKARNLVDRRLDLDTKILDDGREAAFVSAVCFHVTDLRSTTLPVPRLSFEQVNYRVYVRAGSIPAVCFLEMKVNSRMVTAMTSFLSIPVHYDDIEIRTAPAGPGERNYEVRSEGLRATAVIRDSKGEVTAERQEGEATPYFLTQRLVGFIATGNGLFRINVQQTGLDPVAASPLGIQSETLEELGLITQVESGKPHSVLYVREALFDADAPVRE